MDTVTYPNEAVQAELGHWVFAKVDIVEDRAVAERFEVVAVPVVVAITAAGDELGRIENFVEPAAFQERLQRLRR